MKRTATPLPGLDDRAVEVAFERSPRGDDGSRRLYAEAATRLLEHLDPVRLDPRVVLDVGAGFGTLTQALATRYPRAAILALDRNPRRLAAIDRLIPRGIRWPRGHRPRVRLAASWRQLPLQDATTDLAVSNLALQWDAELSQWLAEIARVLRPGGLAVLSTLGPDTLVELRRAWTAVGQPARVSPFPDMHDLGDAMQRNGFADVVLDAERVTVTYSRPRDLLQELRAMEAGNFAGARPRGLTTPRLLAAMLEAYAGDPAALEAGTGRARATIELVFAHAWKRPASAASPRSVEVGLEPSRGSPPSRAGRRRR